LNSRRKKKGGREGMIKKRKRSEPKGRKEGRKEGRPKRGI